MKIPIPHWKVLALPVALWCIGAVMNITAITFNKGAMPVAVPEIRFLMASMQKDPLGPGDFMDKDHKVMQPSDHMKFLCDWIQIPHMGTASPGDGFAELGEILTPYSIGAWLALLWKSHES